MVWRQTTLLSWLTLLRDALLGATADNPIEILDDDIGTTATNPVTISDSEEEENALDDDAPDLWPPRVPYWTFNRGRRNAQFPYVDLGECGCATRCLVGECMNEMSAAFCDDTNCNAGVACGNRLLDCESLQLIRCIKGLGVQTKSNIPARTVIGEYCGYIIPHANLTDTQRNHGFVLTFRSRDINGERVYVDAHPGGSMCRFVNHSCNPNCRFEERSHHSKRKMIIVATREIRAEEEITVLYSRNVSFECLCGEPNCQSTRR